MKKAIVILMAATLAMLTLSGCGEITKAVKDGISTTTELTAVVTTVSVEPKIAYKIVNIEYSNTGSAKRMVARVTISEEDMNKATEADLTEFLKDLTQAQLIAHKPDALMIFLFCEGDKTDSTYTIARSIYAPSGEWGNALSSVNGNYSGYDYVISINTPSERDMWRSFE